MYCDFYFVTTESDHSPFLGALAREMQLESARYSGEPLKTIYLGGGTPSALDGEEVARVLSDVSRNFDTTDVREVTFELNPEDTSPAYLSALKEAGVNRLSIGIQSFFADDLEFMGRSHSVEEARQVIPFAREAGFEQFSIDLIFGLPYQSRKSWMQNLEYAVDEGVPHISTYGLTIEPDTVLAKHVERGLISPAPDDKMIDRYQATMETLKEAGYEHYEISNFARPGARSEHNQLYWDHANYLGLGPSAHSFWWDDTEARRWANRANLRHYISSLEKGQCELDEDALLEKETLADEYLMLRLRTSDGLDLDRYAQHYGRNLRERADSEILELETQGYIHPVQDGALRLTDKGKHVCDTVIAYLLSY